MRIKTMRIKTRKINRSVAKNSMRLEGFTRICKKRGGKSFFAENWRSERYQECRLY